MSEKSFLKLEVGDSVPFREIQVGQWCTWNGFIFIKTTMSNSELNVRLLGETIVRNHISDFSLVYTIKEAEPPKEHYRSVQEARIKEALKIKRESLEILKEISEKLEKSYVIQCRISDSATWIYIISKTIDTIYGKLSERLIEIQGVLSKLLRAWTKQ